MLIHLQPFCSATQGTLETRFIAQKIVYVLFIWSSDQEMLLLSLFQSLLGWRAGLCFVVVFFFNRRRSHCAQPIQYEQQGRCGAQKCHGELWLKLQLPTPSPCVLPAESVCSKAKSETIAQTWVSKFLCCC